MPDNRSYAYLTQMRKDVYKLRRKKEQKDFTPREQFEHTLVVAADVTRGHRAAMLDLLRSGPLDYTRVHTYAEAQAELDVFEFIAHQIDQVEDPGNMMTGQTAFLEIERRMERAIEDSFRSNHSLFYAACSREHAKAFHKIWKGPLGDVLRHRFKAAYVD